MPSYLNDLLKDKISDSSEIELHLFEFCNLNCAFCGQDHNSTVGMSTIYQKAVSVIEFIKKSDLKKHTINIMGGEIFNDEIPHQLFEDYLDFYYEINDYCLVRDIEVRFNWVTNLIFNKNVPEVEKLFSRMSDNAFISTSYDFSGRGLNINRSLQFKHNLNHFKDKIGVVGFVLTRPSIKKLLNDQDKFFKEVLYPNYHLYFDYYVPEKSSDKMLPSDEELLEALRYLAKHYPNVSPVKQMIENEKNEMTCFSLNKVTILPDGREVTCRYLDYQPEDFIHPVDYSSNENIIEAHLERNQCISCQWFNKCTFRCFVQADWKKLERANYCVFKTFFDELESQ